MGVYENLLPGKENALTPEYLVAKCHLSSARMLPENCMQQAKELQEANMADSFYKLHYNPYGFHHRNSIQRNSVSRWENG